MCPKGNARRMICSAVCGVLCVATSFFIIKFVANFDGYAAFSLYSVKPYALSFWLFLIAAQFIFPLIIPREIAEGGAFSMWLGWVSTISVLSYVEPLSFWYVINTSAVALFFALSLSIIWRRFGSGAYSAFILLLTVLPLLVAFSINEVLGSSSGVSKLSPYSVCIYNDTSTVFIYFIVLVILFVNPRKQLRS